MQQICVDDRNKSFVMRHWNLVFSIHSRLLYISTFLQPLKKQSWKNAFSMNKHLVLKGKDEHLFSVSRAYVSAALYKVIYNSTEQ